MPQASSSAPPTILTAISATGADGDLCNVNLDGIPAVIINDATGFSVNGMAADTAVNSPGDSFLQVGLAGFTIPGSLIVYDGTGGWAGVLNPFSLVTS